MIRYVMLLIGLLSPALSQKPYSNPLDNLVPTYGPDLISSYSEDQAQYDGDQSATPVMSGIDMLRMAVPGDPGEDYPILAEVPETSFSCDGRIDGGYYADVEAECQPFHVCTADGDGGLSKYSFLCPNGTLFNQAYFVCEYWFNVDCSVAESFYSLNEELGNSEGFLDTSASSPSGGYSSPVSTYISSSGDSQNIPRNKYIVPGEYSRNTRTGRIQGDNRQVQRNRNGQSQGGKNPKSEFQSKIESGVKRNGRNKNRQNKLVIRPPQNVPRAFELSSKQTNRNFKNISIGQKRNDRRKGKLNPAASKGKQSSNKTNKEKVRQKVNIKQTRNGRQRTSPDSSNTQPQVSSLYLSPEQPANPASNSYLPPTSDAYTSTTGSQSSNQNNQPSQLIEELYSYPTEEVDGSSTLADYNYEDAPPPTYSGASPTAGQSTYISQSSVIDNVRNSKKITFGPNGNEVKGGNSKLFNKKGKKPFNRGYRNKGNRKPQNNQDRNGRQQSPSTGYSALDVSSSNPDQPTSPASDAYLPPLNDIYTSPADSYTISANQNNQPFNPAEEDYSSNTLGDYDDEEAPLPTYSGASPTAGQSSYISQSNINLQNSAQSPARKNRKTKQISLKQNANINRNGKKSFKRVNRNKNNSRTNIKHSRNGRQNSPNTDYAAPAVTSSGLSPEQPAAPASDSYLPPSSDIYTSPTNQKSSPSQSYNPVGDSYSYPNEEYDDSNSESDYDYKETPLPTYSGASPTAGQSKYISQPINSEYSAEKEQSFINISNDDYDEDTLPSYNNGVYSSGSGDNYSAPPAQNYNSNAPEKSDGELPTESEYGAPPESKYGSPADINFGFQTNTEYGAPPESKYGSPRDVTADSGYTGPTQDIDQSDVLPEYYKSEIGLGLAQSNDAGKIDPFSSEYTYTASGSDPVVTAVVPDLDLTYGVPQAPTISLSDYNIPDVSDKGYRGGGGGSYGR